MKKVHDFTGNLACTIAKWTEKLSEHNIETLHETHPHEMNVITAYCGLYNALRTAFDGSDHHENSGNPGTQSSFSR
ncbi:MAG: hypothetical protein FWH07_04945 [Oscillospiraceae bacterium]|nr:hypothetical protein [Oscillospiraceae bacterium]